MTKTTDIIPKKLSNDRAEFLLRPSTFAQPAMKYSHRLGASKLRKNNLVLRVEARPDHSGRRFRNIVLRQG
jgi:hypothetical protein